MSATVCSVIYKGGWGGSHHLPRYGVHQAWRAAGLWGTLFGDTHRYVGQEGRQGLYITKNMERTQNPQWQDPLKTLQVWVTFQKKTLTQLSVKQKTQVCLFLNDWHKTQNSQTHFLISNILIDCALFMCVKQQVTVVHTIRALPQRSPLLSV